MELKSQLRASLSFFSGVAEGTHNAYGRTAAGADAATTPAVAQITPDNPVREFNIIIMQTLISSGILGVCRSFG